MRPDPDQKIPRSAVRAWRISGFFTSLFFWAIPVILLFWWMGPDGPPLWIVVAAGLFALFLTVLVVWLMPEIRWRHWRYQVDEHEVDLKYGIFVIRRILVPIKRVQHVDTRQGPVLRNYGLSSVTISTAATTHEIPALDEETADSVRNQISKLARLAKEDV